MNSLKSNCSSCDTCLDTLRGVDTKLVSIADKLLYNTRFGLNRLVDRNLFTLLSFYKKVLQDVCNDQDCGCYTVPTYSATYTDTPNTGYPTAVINHCVCGCCPPLNPVCNTASHKDQGTSVTLTRENIIERIKILIA